MDFWPLGFGLRIHFKVDESRRVSPKIRVLSDQEFRDKHTEVEVAANPHICFGGEFPFFFKQRIWAGVALCGALNRNCLQTYRTNLLQSIWKTSRSSQRKPAVCSRMDANRRLGMRDTVLALLLALLQGFPLGEAAPNPSPLVGSNWGNPRRYVHLQTSTDLSNFYLEIRLDGTVRKTAVRSSYSKTCFPLF